MRKIIHIDLDAFYASIEQRDDPALKGRPVVVAWSGNRAVVCAASYEARTFGIRSAMPAKRAESLCPDAIFIPPDFAKYRAASHKIREIFARASDAIEPLSLDEAYLDVTTNKTGFSSATAVAEAIRSQISAELKLTASAGVAPNKFLAKVASDVNKPNGIFVIKPQNVLSFLETLPVNRIPGVGTVTEKRLTSLGVRTTGDIRQLSKTNLVRDFGKFGIRLYELSRGIDERPVRNDLPTRSISAEDTFATDVTLAQMTLKIEFLCEKVWQSFQSEERAARTVILKLKTEDFQTLTRSVTPEKFPDSVEELTAIALELRNRVDRNSDLKYRLVGVGLGNFEDDESEGMQGSLF